MEVVLPSKVVPCGQVKKQTEYRATDFAQASHRYYFAPDVPAQNAGQWRHWS